ncbi:MAG: RNA polymerase-associated protein RapA [Pseudomonadota bacterium]
MSDYLPGELAPGFFTPGQCWISDAELNLGIGLIESVEFRLIKVFFPSCNEQRTYAKQSAPLTRLTFSVGDTLQDREGQTIQITGVEEHLGIFSYTGLTPQQQEIILTEVQINPVLQLNRPAERLFNMQIDPKQWFFLRYLTYYYLNQLQDQDLLSLNGSRTSLIPHQLYVAHNVASRYAPRVLLADEVGLGKTIEAGMILQHQLYSERVKRVLVIVPESLLHQWLIEMLRRFNLRFSIFDESRCSAEEESSGMDNPFFTEQLVICKLNFLVNSKQRMAQIFQAQWDMLIVDEAHHLQWSHEQSSIEYQCIEQLAKLTKAVLLLTATPEQLGKESHFARLRLLDPDRFPDFQQFINEELQYKPIAGLIEKLQSTEPFLDSDIAQLEQINNADLAIQQKQYLTVKDTTDATIVAKLRDEIINQLLDRHGTGRVLFRNTRATISGFPKRIHSAYPLDLPAAYQECLLAANDSSISQPQLLLSPEALYQQTSLYQQQLSSKTSPEKINWSDFDGRIDWLGALLKHYSANKVLIITAFSETAQQLNLILKQKFGIHSAVFHEALNLVERDRAAAYFADEEAGCQVLVCSEIGSEGRNFQFSHHLVLFDLPLNPDLLEQRIGRLDRIGQSQDIHLHIPYFKNSAQELLYKWYQHGLGAFENICPSAHQVYKQVQPLLMDFLHHYAKESSNEFTVEHNNFITTTQQLTQQLNQQLHEGRDRLLEFNSCRPALAKQLIRESKKNDKNSQLQHYLEQVFDALGVDSEIYKQNSFIIRPGEKMQLSIKGLEDEGLTCTCDRDTALSNEDMQFLSWTHPLVSDVMDQILSSEMGNTAIITIQSSDLCIDIEAGTLLLESLFIIESKHANIQEMFAVTVNIDGREISQMDRELQSLQPSQIENIDRETIASILEAYKGELKSMLKQAELLAGKKSQGIINRLYKQKLSRLNEEKNRLVALQKINPAVRNEEIEFFNKQINLLQDNKQQTGFRLDALCLIIVT